MMTDKENNKADEALYPPVDPIMTGIRGCCPRCGQGRLFDGFSKVRPACSNCGLDYSFVDAGDGPVVFVLLIVGFIIVGGAFWMEVNYAPPMWVHVIVWLPLLVIIGLTLMRMLKGVLITLQYANKARQGQLDRD